MSVFPEPGGPYDVPEHLYHADQTALSSGGARTLATFCPEKFAYEREHGRPDTPEMLFGRAWHSILLGGPKVVEIGFATLRSKAAEEAAAAARAKGQIPLCTQDYDTAHEMVATLRRHHRAGPLFDRPGQAEQTYVAVDPETGVLCRIRIDWKPAVEAGARVLIVDGKTTRNAHPEAFARSVAEFGYDQQGAFYSDVLTWAGADNGRPPAFIIVAQEKKPPYLLTIHDPLPHVIDGGRDLNREALRLYRRCVDRDEWPGYDPDPQPLDVPGWRAAAYEAAAARRLELIGETA